MPLLIDFVLLVASLAFALAGFVIVFTSLKFALTIVLGYFGY